MNELKIIINAVTKDAQRNIQNVHKELGKIEGVAGTSGKAVDKAMAAMAKGAAVAAGAIAAVTTAMVALGKQSVEFQKAQGLLVSGFQNVGLSAEQAMATYTDMFAFMGEVSEATEASNLLAQLTNDTENLTQWTKILQGVYATFPKSLPIEGLVEAINHTAELGEVQGNLADALEWSGVSVEAFNAALAQTTSMEEREALIRSTLNGLYMNASNIYAQNNRTLIEYNKSQAALDQALASAMTYVVPLLTSLNQLAATLLQVLKPAFETISAVLIAFVQWIIAAIKAVGAFFGLFDKKTNESVSKAVDGVNNNVVKLSYNADKVTDAFKDATKQVAELKRQTMGFDELNVMSSQTAAAAPSIDMDAIMDAIEIPEVEIPVVSTELELPGLEEFEEKVAKIQKQLTPILTLVGSIAAALGLWKLAKFLEELRGAWQIWNMTHKQGITLFGGVEGWNKAQDAAAQFHAKVQEALGIMLVIAGVVLLVKGYSDAWVNGIDWKNFALILGGIIVTVAGLGLAFGPFAAAIGLAVGGIAAIVLGIKDFVTNGYSMESVIMIAVGAITVLIGVIWAFNSALLANPITWVVVGIMALVAAFVILWNECEGFRKFWQNLWQKVKELFNAFVDSIRPLIDAIVFAFNEAWELIKVIWQDYLVPMFKAAWKAIKAVWDAAKPFFEAIWNGIKTIFSVVKAVLGGFFKAAWQVIKGVWDVVVSYFATIVKNIGLVFSVVKSVLTGNFSDAWNGIKKIFSNVGSFFTGVWNTIKGVFKNVGTTIAQTISNTVKTAINGVLSTAVKLINGFIGAINLAISIINAIPGVNIKKIDKLQVPQLATGGIVTGDTLARIGEGGKREAVLPLEQNTEWMDTLADRIASRNQGPSKIVLQVDGTEIGWAAINNINNITRQTGRLQLLTV